MSGAIVAAGTGANVLPPRYMAVIPVGATGGRVTLELAPLRISARHTVAKIVEQFVSGNPAVVYNDLSELVNSLADSAVNAQECLAGANVFKRVVCSARFTFTAQAAIAKFVVSRGIDFIRDPDLRKLAGLVWGVASTIKFSYDRVAANERGKSRTLDIAAAPATPTPSPPPAPAPTPPPAPSPQPPPAPTPTPPVVKGFHISDVFLGGTWARTDPNNGTWYSRTNRPANGAYWYPNGLGVGVDCARRAAAYTVKWADGRVETWNVWFHVTDGKWYPSAASAETTVNEMYGLRAC